MFFEQALTAVAAEAIARGVESYQSSEINE
jgi:hypothetical protein